MLKRTRNHYLALRRPFEPKPIRLIIIAESPPASGLYFYDTAGRATEPLYEAMMKQLGLSRASKEIGLRKFQQKGWILVDATYTPVDQLDNSARDAVIARSYRSLRNDLEALTPDHAVPAVLIKANVCRLLAPKLRDDGFNVLNGDKVIPFPSSGWQIKFRDEFGRMLRSAALK